jgi:hypothetical protein
MEFYQAFSQGSCIFDLLVQWLSETIVLPDQMEARKCYSHSEAQQGSLEPFELTVLLVSLVRSENCSRE